MPDPVPAPTTAPGTAAPAASAAAPANVPAQTGTGAADLASLAAKAFATGATTAGTAADAAAAVTPAAAAAPAAAAKPAAPAAGAPAKLPNTLLSDEPANVAKPEETAKAVADEAAKVKTEVPAYVLEVPASGRLSKEHVAEIEKFAKSHGLTEAQAKQVLARDDLGVANAFDQARDVLMRDPQLGGVNIDQTIATTKRVMQLLWTPEERKAIASMPIANSRLLHAACAKIAAMIPQEDVARTGSTQSADKPVSLGQAMYPHLY